MANYYKVRINPAKSKYYFAADGKDIGVPVHISPIIQ